MADLSPETAAQLQALESSYAENPGRYFVPYAGLLREAGQPGRAEEVLRENLKRFPGLSAHVLLGRCLADRGAHQEASNEFHYVLSIDAQNLIALRTLAEMAAADGRGAEARRWYDELLAVDPMNADARAALGRLAASGADAATADQPAGSGDGWGGAAEEATAAGAGTLSDDADLEWGNLDLGTEPGRSGAEDARVDFEALGFGEVELGGDALPGREDEARQDPGAAADGDLPLLDFGSEDEDGPAPAEAAAADEPEVVTETMAELYASQGMAGRAAELYRELIQRRGEEPGLVRRLAELERAGEAEPDAPDWLLRVDEESAPAAGALPEAEPAPLADRDFGAEAEPAFASEGEPAGADAFAESVSAGFAPGAEEPGGRGRGARAGPAGGAEERAGDARDAWEAPEVVETAEAGGFDLLVIDESVELDGDAHPPASAEEAAELSADWAVAAAPLEEQEVEAETGARPAAESPVGRTMGGYFATLLAWEPGAAAPAEPGEPEAAASAEPAGAAAPEAPAQSPWEEAATEPEEPLPWELPADATAGEEPAPETPAEARGAGFSFEEFFSPEPAAEPEREAERAPPAAAAPPAAEAPAAQVGGTEAAGAPAGGEQDEDLESFQAWLQSLKR